MADVLLSDRDEFARGGSDAKRSAVIEEMNLVISHPLFRSSNHCVALFRYVVGQAIAGETTIKERTLGVEVFGRTADYDVATDPIVRRIAGEVRKKLAQYYQQRTTGWSVRIHLNRGNYLPEFEFATTTTTSVLNLTAEELAQKATFTEGVSPGTPSTIQFASAGTHLSRRKWIVGFCAALLIALAYFSWVHEKQSADFLMWKPFRNSGQTIVICLPLHNPAPNSVVESPPNSAPTSTASNTDSADSDPSTLFRDIRAGDLITALLSNFKMKTDLRPANAIKFRDLQQAPVVLIGGLNNPWVTFVLSNLRYSLHFDGGTREAWIQDAQDPLNRDWRIKEVSENQPPPADYALITRLFDQQTKQWVMALSGLQGRGTEAAAELISDPKYANLIPHTVRDDDNFQLVIRTTIIGGEPGPIQVLAVQVW